ncbi:MAG: sulfatase-like hydrolase/transferase, partial [Bdellovibrionota bacterium]
FLNGYPLPNNQNYFPPGWTHWWGGMGGEIYRQFDYQLNIDGKPTNFGSNPEEYLTDVLADKAVEVIQAAHASGTPFFIHLTSPTPHQPARAAPRHSHLFTKIKAPRPHAFDEEDVSDKPAWLRAFPRLSAEAIEKIDTLYRKRLRSLQAVDDLVERLVLELEKSGQLANTYIVFMSDNGFHMGGHRLTPGKQTIFEEDIRVPLFIRGPGVLPGSTVEEFALNTDLAPTFADVAGISRSTPAFIDGRSLRKLFSGGDPFAEKSMAPAPSKRDLKWRTAIMIEHDIPGDHTEDGPFGKIPRYRAIRTHTQTYAEYLDTGEAEFYDLESDPSQLNNLTPKKDSPRPTALADRLHRLMACAGATCRSIEDE